jgi:chondroitin AC lyase
VFPAPTTVTVCAQTQSGNWHRVHSRESARGVARDVFSLWIDHGDQPHGAGYAYLVFPDVDASALPSLCRTLPVTILQQTASILAVAGPDGKFIQATFFEPGRLAWGNASSLEVNVPCLAMWDATADVIHLYVADPTHTQKSVKLWLSGRYVGPQARYDAGRRQTELTITLPPEGFAGQTVGLELRAERP